MEVDFRYKDYVCNYYGGHKYSKYVCFSKGFGSDYDGHVIVSYILYKRQHQKNMTFFSSSELLDVITILSKELGFTLFSINENKSYFRIQIKMYNDKRWNLYVSSFIRYLFEYPASLASYCAYKNYKNYKHLKFTMFIQYYLATVISLDTIHCIGNYEIAIRNISPKNLYDFIKDYFNGIPKKLKFETNNYRFDEKYDMFYVENLPKIVKEINNKVNELYESHKEDLCCWR